MSYLSRLGWQAVGLSIAVSVALLLLLAYCSERDRAKESENARDFVEGRTLSAGDAIEAIHELGERDQATQQDVQEAQDAIRETPAGPARSARARYELCRLQHRPDCDRMLRAG